jgi:hypothetical protein
MRVSCAYEVSQALNANSSAAITAARRPNIRSAPHAAHGIVSRPASSDSECVAASESPNPDTQMCSSM